MLLRRGTSLLALKHRIVPTVLVIVGHCRDLIIGMGDVFCRGAPRGAGFGGDANAAFGIAVSGEISAGMISVMFIGCSMLG